MVKEIALWDFIEIVIDNNYIQSQLSDSAGYNAEVEAHSSKSKGGLTEKI